jgi:putative endonuclease
MKRASHLSIGRIGESAAAYFLERRGLRILVRNYRRKCGEIDIIALQHGIIHFVEVKTCRLSAAYAPAENIHYHKLRRLIRTAQVYLINTRQTHRRFVFDAICVYIDEFMQRAKVTYIENIVE